MPRKFLAEHLLMSCLRNMCVTCNVEMRRKGEGLSVPRPFPRKGYPRLTPLLSFHEHYFLLGRWMPRTRGSHCKSLWLISWAQKNKETNKQTPQTSHFNFTPCDFLQREKCRCQKMGCPPTLGSYALCFVATVYRAAPSWKAQSQTF